MLSLLISADLNFHSHFLLFPSTDKLKPTFHNGISFLFIKMKTSFFYSFVLKVHFLRVIDSKSKIGLVCLLIRFKHYLEKVYVNHDSTFHILLLLLLLLMQICAVSVHYEVHENGDHLCGNRTWLSCWQGKMFTCYLLLHTVALVFSESNIQTILFASCPFVHNKLLSFNIHIKCTCLMNYSTIANVLWTFHNQPQCYFFLPISNNIYLL